MAELTEYSGKEYGFPNGRIVFIAPTQDTSQAPLRGEIAGIMVQGRSVTHVVFYPGFDDNMDEYQAIPTPHGKLYLYPIKNINPEAPDIPVGELLHAIHEQRLKLGDSGPKTPTEEEQQAKLLKLLRARSDAEAEMKVNAEFIARSLPTGFVPFLTKLVQSQQRPGTSSPGGDL